MHTKLLIETASRILVDKVVQSIQFDRKDDGSQHGVKGGRPLVYDYAAFEKEMIENDPDHYYLSEHMKLWMIENWGTTREYIQKALRKSLWRRFSGPSQESLDASKAYRQTLKARLEHRSRSFKKKKNAEKASWSTQDLVDYLEEFQELDLEKGTCLDFYDGTLIYLNEENWQLDHYEVADNSLDNLVLTREQYNQMKNCWTIDETLDACERLLKAWRPSTLKDTE